MHERDLHGQRIVITGATGGIGTELARALARRGAELTLVARNPDKAQATAAELAREEGATGTPGIVIGDLADLASVRRAAAELHERLEGIDVLINNAGVHTMYPRTTVDDFDEMAVANHLGPFLLTNLLLDLLKSAAPSRIVVTASEAHRMSSGIDLATFAEPAEYGTAASFRRYGQSKLLNILFTQELARRLDGSGVTANCFCPGINDTGLVQDSRAGTAVFGVASRLRVVRKPEVGARMGVRLVVDSELEGVTGKFFTTTPGARLLPTRAERKDQALQGALWERSAELVGL